MSIYLVRPGHPGSCRRAAVSSATAAVSRAGFNGPMRFTVLGAGAIGAVIGGRLFPHGHEVILVARGAHQQTLAADGLTLQAPDETVRLPIPAVPHPGRIDYRDDDVVVLAVKSQDTARAVRSLAAAAPPSVAVVCAQNGVDNEPTALRWFAGIYGMCVMCPATHLSPGVVQAHSVPITGLLDPGRWPTGLDGRAEAVSAALAAASFDSRPRAHIARWKWASWC
jgi:2-dehydropantoate 2-reductase